MRRRLGDHRLRGLAPRFGVALFLLALLSGCGQRSFSTESARALKYLPADTSILFVSRVSAFADTDAFARAEREILMTPGVGDVLRTADLSLRDAVDRIYLAVTDEMDPRRISESGGFVALVKTNLEDGFLHDIMTQAKHNFRVELVDDAPVWVRRDGEESIALAALSGGYLGFGPFDSVREMVLRSHEKMKGLTSRNTLLQSFDKEQTESALWGAAELRGRFASRGGNNPFAQSLNAVHHLTWTASHDAINGLTLHVNAISTDEDAANHLRTDIEAIVGLSSMGGSRDPAIDEMFQTISVQTTANVTTVRLIISPELVSRLAEVLRVPDTPFAPTPN